MEHENNPLEITPTIRDKYFKGRKNQSLRVYFYLREGLNVLNDFRYLALGIFGVAVLFKLESSMEFMGTLFAVAVPVLIVIGYFWVHFAKRRIDWFTVEYTTHWSKYDVQLAEQNMHLLKEILEELRKK